MRRPEYDIRAGNKFETPRLIFATNMEVEIQLETSEEETPNAAEGDTECKPNPQPLRNTNWDPEVGELFMLKRRGKSNVNAKEKEPDDPELEITKA